MDTHDKCDINCRITLKSGDTIIYENIGGVEVFINNLYGQVHGNMYCVQSVAGKNINCFYVSEVEKIEIGENV